MYLVVGSLEVFLVEVKVSAEGPHGEQGAQQGRLVSHQGHAVRVLLVLDLQSDQSAYRGEGSTRVDEGQNGPPYCWM